MDERAFGDLKFSGSEIWLDVSRMLWRVYHGRLTGIDRVEVSYAEQLLELAPERLRFVSYNYWRRSFSFLPLRQTASLVRQIAPCWGHDSLKALKSEALSLFVYSQSLAKEVCSESRSNLRPAYLNVSSHPLHFTGPVTRMLCRTGARFVPLIHDLIPIDHPEYVPARWTKHHRRRLAVVGGFADGVIANSVSTLECLRPYVPPGVRMLAAPLGNAKRLSPPSLNTARSRPYFLCLGTIEPRKNHLMLLNVWRRLAETGKDVPELLIIGRRGWENEQVIDMLDRCRLIHPYVKEMGVLSDTEVSALMNGACALLMPSFTEGYSLPVAEALSAGLPVVCSDIAPHREVGAGIPDFIDSLDGMAWLQAVQDFSCKDSLRRAAQISRLRSWRTTTWRVHVKSALDFIDTIADASRVSGMTQDRLRNVVPVTFPVSAAAA